MPVRRISSSGALTVTLILAGLVLASCAPGADPYAHAPGAAGFWRGLWHGMIVPVTFVISLFSDHVGLYELHNNGGWYDFGFVIGASIAFGGGSRVRPPRRRYP